MGLPLWETLLRMLLATGVGMLLGFEREKSKKPAGMRTHMLICLAACLIAIISAYGFNDPRMYWLADTPLRSDPARLVVGVLTGIGFIGAGIIWKSPTGSVQGITTAAEIFLLSALGIAAGLGHYVLVAAGTLIAILTMAGDDLVDKFRDRLNKRRGEQAEQQACRDLDQEAESEAGQIQARRRHRRLKTRR